MTSIELAFITHNLQGSVFPPGAQWTLLLINKPVLKKYSASSTHVLCEPQVQTSVYIALKLYWLALESYCTFEEIVKFFLNVH